MRFSLFLFSVFISLSLLAQSQETKLRWADSTLQDLSATNGTSFDRSKWLSDSVVSIYSRTGRACDELSARGKRSNFLRGMGHYDQALREALEVLNTFSGECDSSIFHDVLLTIAYTYHDLSDPVGVDSTSGYAMNFIKPRHGKMYLNLVMLRGIGRFMMGDQAGGRGHFINAVQLAEEQQAEPDILIKSYTTLGTFYSFLYFRDTTASTASRYRDSSLTYHQKALKKAYHTNQMSNISTIYNSMAGLMYNDLDKRRTYMDSAIVVARATQNIADLPVYLRNKAIALAGNHKYEEAFNVLIAEYVQLQDSLYNKNRLKAIAEVEERYRSKLRVEENRRLTSELLLKEGTIKKNRTITSLVSGGGLVILLALGLLISSHRKVQKERKASDELLLNILPSETARELKEKGYTTAHRFDKATVLFADIKDFTQISEAMSAEELVKELDRYFKEFDQIVYEYKLEKIKSIGDAYICAAGLPETNTSDATDAVKAALAMQAKARKIKQKRIANGETYFEFRCGIHTGSVVAGVVGIKKWQYDIWGDTVNLAARMEQSSEPGKINISQVTYQQVKDQFTCIPRGKIYAKNKGEVEMYFVEDKIA